MNPRVGPRGQPLAERERKLLALAAWASPLAIADDYP